MILVLVAVLFSALYPSPTVVETDRFAVMYGDKEIGELVAEKRVSGDRVTYATESRSEFSLFGKHSVVHTVEATFQGSRLMVSRMRSEKDGKVKNNTLIQWKGDHYEVNENGDLRRHEDPIRMTSVMLYFKKPPLSAQVLSERDATFRYIEPISSNAFTLTSGKRNDSQDYSYNNGQLAEVLVRNALFTIQIKRK